MAKKKGGLGKGIESLIPAAKKAENPETGEAYLQNNADKSRGDEDKSAKSETAVRIGKVEPNRNQPRKNFDEKALEELASSIKRHGIITPLIVKDRGDYFEIIAGERRWRAARMAGLKEVPVIVRDYSDAENAEVALVENIQREDLNAIEEALAYQALIDEFGLTHAQVAEKVSKSRSAVSNAIGLLKFSEKIRQKVAENKLSAGHLNALKQIRDEKLRDQVAEHIAREQLSVRNAEALSRKSPEQLQRILEPSSKKTKALKPEDVQTSLFYKKTEDELTGLVGTKVRIRRQSGGKGRIEISYSSLEDLERIADLFKEM